MNIFYREARSAMFFCASAMVISMVSNLVVTSDAFADQVPSAQTDVADPGRLLENLRDEKGAPKLVPEIEVGRREAMKAPKGADKVAFQLDQLEIDGVTAYESEDLFSVYSESIGENITLSDLYGIAGAITRKYRDDGYVLTQVVVPPQTIEGGVAKIRIVEGYIDQVFVEGDVGKAGNLIRKYAASIKNDDGALNVSDLERALLLINDLPGVSARGVIDRSDSKVGAANITIFVERNPLDAIVSFDNYGSRYLGPLQAMGAVSLNNYLFEQNERLTLQMAAVPDSREMAYGAVSYEQPVWDKGTIVRLFASTVVTEPGYDLDQYNVDGNSQLVSLSVSHPFIRTREFSIEGRMVFDWRNVRSENIIDDMKKDRVSAFRVGSNVNFLDTFLGIGLNSVDLEVSHGLDILGASDERRSYLSRPRADLDFVKVELEAQRLQRVTKDVNVLVAFNGQISSGALLSSEEFGVGGVNYGRAYDPSEIVGDEGIAAKFEIQWNRDAECPYLEGYQLFGFYDAGRVWNDDATTSSDRRSTITSAGAGIRTDFIEDVGVDFTVAFPLNKEVNTQNDKDPRFYLGVTKRF